MRPAFKLYHHSAFKHWLWSITHVIDHNTLPSLQLSESISQLRHLWFSTSTLLVVLKHRFLCNVVSDELFEVEINQTPLRRIICFLTILNLWSPAQKNQEIVGTYCVCFYKTRCWCYYISFHWSVPCKYTKASHTICLHIFEANFI